jgi:AraC family transcriptional regulator
MSSRSSRSEYESRMHRVVAYIDQHLDQPLELQTLAEVAHFSAYHFHRLFSAWMGETLGDYLRRRRLEIAAMRLVSQPRSTILEIAFSTGFGSAEAFARAFKNRFGCSPTAWRTEQAARRPANSNPGQVKSKIGQARAGVSLEHADSSQTRTQETIMHVKLVDRQPVPIAYLRHLGPYGEPISRFWQNTYFPWAVTNGLLDRPRYGISHDDPGVTAPEQCRYDACVEVAPDFIASGGALKTSIPGGRYAVLAFKGNVEQIGEAWAALLRDWLPSSELQLDARPCFEYYPKDATYDAQSGTFSCEICVPVVPL